MGALHGSMSYLRFLVDGEVAKNPGTTYERALESRRFLPLSPSAEPLESAGWVPLEAPFDDELALTRDLFLFGELIAVAYREDRYAIPRAVVKRETRRRVEKIVREEGKDPKEMGRAFLKAVEAAALAELKAKTLPRTRLCDVLWDLKRGEMRIFGRGTLVTERVSSLIERTFQVRVEQAGYPARAFSLDLGSRAGGVLERLSPGWLFPDAGRGQVNAPEDEEAA
ncbi:MAG: recombination-associated protein RdgC [Deltaproteobacteria bacterium]|nr:recombination-associated protein RdgC [Deltaproteobacteria bacterium]